MRILKEKCFSFRIAVFRNVSKGMGYIAAWKLSKIEPNGFILFFFSERKKGVGGNSTAGSI